MGASEPNELDEDGDEVIPVPESQLQDPEQPEEQQTKQHQSIEDRECEWLVFTSPRCSTVRGTAPCSMAKAPATSASGAYTDNSTIQHLGPCERTSLRVSNKQGPPGTENCPMLDPSGTSPWLLVGTLAARLVG